MTHVVRGLREKGLVTVQADLALHGIPDDRQVEQFGTLLLRGFLQPVKKTHGAVSSENADSLSCSR
ncbi:hypothetical protein D3C79_1058890 [compost metagenome]